MLEPYNCWDSRPFEMPQTVPSAGYTPPCDYSNFAADCFDLSLLPSPDSEVPYSPLNIHHVMSFYSDSTTSPPSMFPGGGGSDDAMKEAVTVSGGDVTCDPVAVPGPVMSQPQCSPSPYHLPLSAIKEEPAHCSYLPSPPPALSPTPSLSPSPSASATDHRLLRQVLRDTSFQRRYNLKPLDLAALQAPVAPPLQPVPAAPQPAQAAQPAQPTSGPAPAPTPAPAPPAEVKLEEGDAALQLSSERMEPVLSLAIQHLRKDVGDACSALGIPPDPARWAACDVRAWLLWTLRQYSLPMIPMEYFDMDGAALASLSEHDFQQRAPQCGSTLYAQLEIWKAACQDLDIHWTNSSTSSSSTGDELSDGEEEMELCVAGSVSGVAGTSSDCRSGAGKAPSGRAGGSGSGTHIHLWQFLKELLAAPQLHGSCIRWLDRSKGVFKIEDSVRVARLWGKRKNRPAMNYDKLSRSIRQYYKKGIMKKTERSQRLVYQFCHPYSL